jgi:hypothetical protein
MLVNHTGTLRTYSELVGRMFIEKNCLNKEQASAVRDRIVNEVALLDNLEWDNAWNFYNSVATSLRMSHPKNWFEDQSTCHELINGYFNLVELTKLGEELEERVLQDSVHEDVQDIVQEPTNQLNIFDVIEEVDVTPKLSSPTDVIVDEIPEEFFTFEEPETTTFELPDL